MSTHPALPSAGPGGLPAVIVAAGESATRRFLEFFAAEIRNANTRAAYALVAVQFLAWADGYAIALAAVQPIHVAAYIEQLGTVRSVPTVKQNLAALKHLFDYLVIGQILPTNPAAAVRGPTYRVREGKTPILSAEETRQLFARFDPAVLADVRDRAILGAMVYSFARVSAVTKLRVKDYLRQGARAWFVLEEKGGQHPLRRLLPAERARMDAEGIRRETRCTRRQQGVLEHVRGVSGTARFSRSRGDLHCARTQTQRRRPQVRRCRCGRRCAKGHHGGRRQRSRIAVADRAMIARPDSAVRGFSRD